MTTERTVEDLLRDGPRAGLALLDTVADRLGGTHRVDAVRAHLLEQAGEPEAARAAYQRAARATTSLPERRYLEGRAARLPGRPVRGRPASP